MNLNGFQPYRFEGLSQDFIDETDKHYLDDLYIESIHRSGQSFKISLYTKNYRAVIDIDRILSSMTTEESLFLTAGKYWAVSGQIKGSDFCFWAKESAYIELLKSNRLNFAAATDGREAIHYFFAFSGLIIDVVALDQPKISLTPRTSSQND
ncbi:hypothetical protein [Saprospira grandis]|uniref:hypothetical protein n=1 Tax=Saprospira grandis TaxID=1008 RepID=UPI0022DDAA1D|nr:hypothetical protein [Saprospira grandis]WBM74413.1 hypothetical protein OP864_15615 [Saprospira grandis]